jgi:ribokinase
VPAHLLGLTDHLVVNEHEVEIVLGVAAADLVADRGGARTRARAATAASIHLTLGSAGALVLTGDDAIVVPGHAVEVVDTTGAGDCYVGTIAARLVAGASVVDAAVRAGAAAALSVTRPGAAPSMPTAAEVDAFLARGRGAVSSPARPPF